MLIASANKKAEFEALLPSVNAHAGEWQIASVRLPNSDRNEMVSLSNRLVQAYGEKEGMIFVRNDKVVMLMRVVSPGDSGTFKADLDQKLAGKGYHVMVREMNAQALKQVEAHLVAKDDVSDTLFHARLVRPENRVLIIDDDFLYRALLLKECEGMAAVHEVEDGKNAVQLYQDINPDIVFLDIHLPATPGFSVLESLTNIDFDAYVVMLSSDTSRHNVLQAMKKGAATVLKKPPEAAKLLRVFRTCPTFKKPKEQKETVNS